MRRVLHALILGLVLPAHAHAAVPDATGRLLVTLKPAAAAGHAAARAAAVHAVASAAGARPSGFSVPQIRLVTVSPRPGESLHALAARLRADPRVASVVAERRAALRFQPNDPALVTPETAKDTAPGTMVEWWAARSGFPQAWDISQGAGATVAVIDTGAEIGHPELAGRIAGLASFDAARSPAGLDTNGHGTHVASLACGAGNNGVGLAGAGLGCQLLVIKSDFSDSSVAASIVWAVDHNADAINMSFGTDPGATPSLPVLNAIDYAVAHGVVLVSAAADKPIEDQGYPASILQPTGTGPDLNSGKGLSVTAADFLDRRAPFAGRGSQVSLAAYGTYDGNDNDGPPGIFGAFTTALNAFDTGALGQTRPCRCRTVFGADARYAYLQGTSMAAPMVAAAAALVRHLNPDMPAAEIVRLAHARGIPVLLDASQAAYHMRVDVRALDCDFLVATGHKMYGPTGIGILYGKASHFEAMPPFLGGGDMISSVTFERSTWNVLPYKFEAGTPNIEGAIGLHAALDYIDGVGLEAITAYERDLLAYGTRVLEGLDRVRLVGTAREKAGILSFVIDGVHPHDVGTIVDREGVAIRTGHHCAQPLMDRFGLPATARASIAMYNTREELDVLGRAVHKVLEVFG